MKNAAFTCKKYGMLAALFLLSLFTMAQTRPGWHVLKVDSAVSVEVPDGGKTPGKDILYLYRNDSCGLVVQSIVFDTTQYLDDVRKFGLDQWIGFGFDVLDDKPFEVSGHQGSELRLINNRNSLEVKKEIRYYRIFPIGKKQYYLGFWVSDQAFEQRFAKIKNYFFASLRIHAPVQQAKPVPAKTKPAPQKKNNFLLYAAVFLMVCMVLLRIFRKKPKP